MLESLGLRTSEAIYIFLKQLVLQGGMPFQVKIPNRKTIDALKELNSESRKSRLSKFSSVEALMIELDS